jgi:ERCC4-type nuclease
VKKEQVSPNSITRFLLSIALKDKFRLIFTKDAEDTCQIYRRSCKKKETRIFVECSKKTLNKQERMEFILESFLNRPKRNARKLLENSKLFKIYSSPA